MYICILLVGCTLQVNSASQVNVSYPTSEMLSDPQTAHLQLRPSLTFPSDDGSEWNANNHTNLNSMSKQNKENCSINFRSEALNVETRQINFEPEKGSNRNETKPITCSYNSSFQNRHGALDETAVGADLDNVGTSGLRFLDIPKGDDLRIGDLRLEQEHLLFEAFSDLMGYLQPSGFPADLLREALHRHFPVHLVVFQILRLDIVLIIWIIVWALLALCLPFGVAANLCCLNNITRLDEDFSITSENNARRKTEVFFGICLHILLILLLTPILLILAANEQLSRSISQLPMSVEIIYGDVNTFLRNTHMQISFAVTSSTDMAIEGVKKDLEDIEELLGKPYQQELSSVTGIDAALIDLDDLKKDTEKVTSLISDLLTDCASARISSALLHEELNDISRQLTIIKQQCSLQDRSLCYTLLYSGFDLIFTAENITNDAKIRQLDRLGVEVVFNKSIEAAKKTFSQLPKQVTAEAASLLTETKTLLSRKRTEVYKSTHSLDILVRSVSESLRTNEKIVTQKVKMIAEWDLWRWLSVLGIATLLSLVWGLLLCGAPCGCGITTRTIPVLIAGLSFSCISCLLVWALGTVSIILGAHGKALVCNPLYDYPKFEVLGELFDEKSVFYEDGLMEDFRDGNESLKITEVLKHCQRNQPAYQTFRLHQKINVNTVLNYRQWEDLKNLFSNFTLVGESNLEILGSSLQVNLQALSTASTVNLTAYRLLASSPITKRDLNTFADQLNTVARQISEPVTARKFDNLAFSVRKIVQNELHKLVETKNRMLFKITMLEVLLPPLNRKVEVVLKQLRNIQYFLDNEGWQVAEKTRKRFVSRLESYLEELYDYVNAKVTKEIGKCGALWELFHAARFYVCKFIVDPLNGVAFCSFFLILVFLTVAPVIIKLVEYYRESNDDVLTSISHRRSRNGLMIDDECIWATPPSDTPDIQLEEPTTSAFASPVLPHLSPRRPSPQRIPIPPRPPSRIPRVQSPRIYDDGPSTSRVKSPKTRFSGLTSKLAKARNLTQMSVSRPRSPRRGHRNHDSLRLVEPIAWKVGSTTPRSWI